MNNTYNNIDVLLVFTKLIFIKSIQDYDKKLTLKLSSQLKKLPRDQKERFKSIYLIDFLGLVIDITPGK